MEYFGSGDPPSGCFIAGTPTFIHGRAAEWARVLQCVSHVPALLPQTAGTTPSWPSGHWIPAARAIMESSFQSSFKAVKFQF